MSKVSILSFVAGCSVATLISHILSKKMKRSSTAISQGIVGTSTSPRIPDDIRTEQLSRHTLYFGTEGMGKLQGSRVCIVGVGGVGSHTAHMLARSGVSHIRIIDFDQVSVSSLNRHACAVLADVGTSKVECLASFLRKICPDERYLKIETRASMYTAESGPSLLSCENLDHEQYQSKTDPNHHPKWDMVIDCIDDIPSKVALLEHCLREQIRVVSCMGAGGKSDPTRLHISDLRSASRDPLASKLRQSLKKSFPNDDNKSSSSYLDNMDQLTVLFSSEKTVVKLADFTPEQKKQGVHLFGAVDGMRIRIVPVLGTMPAIMGQALASICVTVLAEQPMQPVTSERVGHNTRNKIYQKFRLREQHFSARLRADIKKMDQSLVTTQETKSVNGEGQLITVQASDGDSKKSNTTWIGPVQIDQSDDMEYEMEIWRNRCAVTGARLGTVLHLIRWDLSKPSTCDNIVLVSANVLPKYESDPENYKNAMDSTVREAIEERLDTCRIDR